MNRKTIGKCSICGGAVTVPTVTWSVIPPRPQCEKCGAYASKAAGLPTVPMEPMRIRPQPFRSYQRRPGDPPWVKYLSTRMS